MGNLIGQAGLLQGCNGVAAAYDGDSTVLGSLSNSLGNSQSTICKSIKLEYAHRTIPDNGLGTSKSLAVELRGLRAAVQSLPIIRNLVYIYDLNIGIW